MQVKIMKLNGMTGEACAEKINDALLAIKGVGDVTVSLAGRKLSVQFDENQTSLQELQATLTRNNYSIEAVLPEEGRSGCCGGCGGQARH
jgi:copper chaperone CopZ